MMPKCGCTIEYDGGDPRDGGSAFIHQCPLCKAAGALLEALQNLTGCFSTNMLDQNDNRKHWMAGLAAIRAATAG